MTEDGAAWPHALLRAAQGEPDALGGWQRVRDLSLLPIAPGLRLVVACDSIGGIGPKQHDAVYATGEEVGRFAARVVLQEVIACGATPILVIDTLSVEHEPTGAAIIAGVREEMCDAGMDTALSLNGSTEENVSTVATGVGIVALGLVAETHFRPGRARPGDLVICVGVPKSAPHHRVVSDDPDIIRPRTLKQLAALDMVGDILPVGSRGVSAEAHTLAASAGLTFAPDATPPFDLTASGGPGTCCLAALSPEAVSALASVPDLPPVAVIGRLGEGV